MSETQNTPPASNTRSALPPAAYWLLLIPISLASRMFDQWLTDQTFVAMNAKTGGLQLLFLYGALGFVSSAFIPLFSTLIIFKAWRLRTAAGGSGSTFLQMVKEELRAFGSIMMWAFLFILPGFWKMLEYVFVAWVVALDPEYDRGEVDALKESRRLFYRVWPLLIPFVFVTMVLIPLFMTSFDTYRSFIEYPLVAGSLSLVDLALFILFQWVLLKIWNKARSATKESEALT